jgi:hypothetical protein
LIETTKLNPYNYDLMRLKDMNLQLDPRIRDIIAILATENGFVTSEELALKLELSSRTIRDGSRLITTERTKTASAFGMQYRLY